MAARGAQSRRTPDKTRPGLQACFAGRFPGFWGQAGGTADSTTPHPCALDDPQPSSDGGLRPSGAEGWQPPPQLTVPFGWSPPVEPRGSSNGGPHLFPLSVQENKIRAITFITGRGGRPGRFESRSKMQRPHLIHSFSYRQPGVTQSHILPVPFFFLFPSFTDLSPLAHLLTKPDFF